MRLTELLNKYDLSNSLLIGYYGGGNYGDELLLEILQNIFSQKGFKNVQIAYQKPNDFATRHKNFGYQPIDIHKPLAVIAATLGAKNIVIGGGGLWGVDINATTLLLGPYLFFVRYVLRKRVFLLGVGFYDSTNFMGRLSAAMAGRAANWIIGRDKETMANFGRHSRRISQDVDMAWHATDISAKLYKADIDAVDKLLQVKPKTLVVTLRRFRHQNPYAQIIEQFLLSNHTYNVIVMTLEGSQGDPESHQLISRLRNKRPDYQYLTHSINPMALFLFFARHAQKLRLIGPQFHIIITAHINKVSFLPLVYDNKVEALFEQIGVPADNRITINQLQPADITDFLRPKEA